MSDQIEQILRNPSVLKTPEGDEYTDDTSAKWAWFAHGYDTGMEPFYSIEQLREAVRAAVRERNEEKDILRLVHPPGSATAS